MVVDEVPSCQEKQRAKYSLENRHIAPFLIRYKLYLLVTDQISLEHLIVISMQITPNSSALFEQEIHSKIAWTVRVYIQIRDFFCTY